jgi:hypothetical protein
MGFQYLWVFNIYGFSMAVSPFDRLERSRSRIVAGRVLARQSVLSLKTGNLAAKKKAYLGHAIASVAPATSSKSPLCSLTHSEGLRFSG